MKPLVVIAALAGCAHNATESTQTTPQNSEAAKPVEADDTPAAPGKPTPAALPPKPSFTPTSFTPVIVGHGRPMILIPGLGCPASIWDETAAHVTNIESHKLELAGFAGNPPIDKPLMKTVTEELAIYIRDRQLDHPIIVGHSLGGSIAIWLAIEEPDLVGPVVVVDGRPALGGDKDSIAVAKQLREGVMNMNDREFKAAFRAALDPMIDNKKRLDALVPLAGKSDHRAFGDAMVELFSIDLRPRLSRIRAPLLMVLPKDRDLEQSARASTNAIKTREVAIVPNALHFIMLDNPDGFFAVLDAFLAAHP